MEGRYHEKGEVTDSWESSRSGKGMVRERERPGGREVRRMYSHSVVL